MHMVIFGWLFGATSITLQAASRLDGHASEKDDPLRRDTDDGEPDAGVFCARRGVGGGSFWADGVHGSETPRRFVCS